MGRYYYCCFSSWFFSALLFCHTKPWSSGYVSSSLESRQQSNQSLWLKKDGPHYTYKYEAKDGDYNLIEVDGDRIRVKEANCADLVDVRRGWISKPGETPIACLPHNLFITVEASDGSEDGSLIY